MAGSADVFTFLFLPANSFLFFYNESISFDLKGDPPISIENITRKKDEPDVYSNENGYTITNSWSNIDRYNTYIELVTHLSVYYFRFWESWIANIFEEKD